ncbi:MAG TPA: serine hydrolase domain-containing protein [Bacillota bacterium]|nr:serine hydrolase domain-containing protein [Bacillota bacterium]
MKHPFVLLPLCGLVALCVGDLAADQPQPMNREPSRRFAPPEAPVSAEEILRRALNARGGEAAAAGIQSFHCQGTADFAWGGRAAYESLAARPNQERTSFDFGGGSRYEFVCDGQTAWEARPGSAPAAKDGEKLRESLDGAAFFAWCDAPRACRSVAYVGETSFDGTRCYALKVITQSGLEQTHYYNASNYLLAGMVARVTLETGPTWCRTSFLEYRTFAGFLFPTRLRGRIEESEWVIRVNSIQVNCVDGSTFKRPAALAAVQADVPVAAPSASLSDAEIQTMLQDCIEADKLGVGLVVGLVDAQGSRVISYGKMDNATGPEVNGDTLFEIGSITKVFTRLLLHDMVGRGELNLDDPVQKYLPAAVRMPTRHGRQITLWDLTTHTSGLPREMDGPQTVERLYAFLASHKLRRDPGQEFDYSNVGMELLGHVIALKAGQDYETLVRERICRPLKMDSTAITLTPELQARRATGHAPANRSVAYIGLQALPGAGALFSTANDMLKFASATLGLTPCSLMPLMKKTNVGHNGGTFGFSTLLAFDVKQRRALVVLANCRNDNLVNHLQPLLRNQSPKPPCTVPVSAEVCDRYVGQYYVRENRLRTIRRQGDRLLLQEVGEPSCEVFPLSETNFYNPLFDCRATFVPDGNTGRARELILGDVANPRWRGMRIPGQVLEPATCPLTEADCSPRADSDLQGVWQGTLRLWYWPFVAYHLKIRAAEPAAGSFRADADSLDQGVTGEPLYVVYHRPVVEVGVVSGDGWFQGKINPAHTKVTGHWKQSGRSVRVTFRRVELPGYPKAEGRDSKEGRKPKRETRS